MFVAGFEVDIDKNWKPYFRFVCTTKRLVMLLKHNSLIASDGTYKLIWQGYPVLMSGTIDRDRKYHPAGICVAITETQVDYAFFFRTLRDVYFKIASVHFHAEVLIGDAAPAITNGFVEVFGSCPKRVICWAHVIRNVDGKLKSINKKKIKTRIRRDILNLQLSTSEEIFNQAAQLLFEKWYVHSISEVKSFITYFKQQWLDINMNWYEGYLDGN